MPLVLGFFFFLDVLILLLFNLLPSFGLKENGCRRGSCNDETFEVRVHAVGINCTVSQKKKELSDKFCVSEDA